MAVAVSGQTIVTDEALTNATSLKYELRISWRGLVHDYAEVTRSITAPTPLALMQMGGQTMTMGGVELAL